ncbi:MAG TPA: allantoate deiminase [Candidatus Nosocomiicoccus stercorigallinarum]|nr:allantoate deiminase [Candidatus Nosocomiicoccus stercorigallinarum]
MDIRTTFQQLDEKFSRFGGLEPRGITRLLYTSEWRAAINALVEEFENNDLEVIKDSVGNVSGRLVGENSNETILTGSHIDTVVQGGHLDGQYGILASLTALLYLKENYGQPKKNIEVLALAEEEGSRFPIAFWGSKNFFNIQDNEIIKELTDSEGVNFVDAMRESGFDFREDDKVRDDIKAWLEIHIEQGQILEKEQKQIGVVTGIVGFKRYSVQLKGEANHAGTTPMGYRKDTVVAFSEIVQKLDKKAKEIGDPLVITFGKVKLIPNVTNVVPGEIEFSIDTRHIDEAELNDFSKTIENTINEIAIQNELEATITLHLDEKPTLMNEDIIKTIEESSKKVTSNNYKRMVSGAGHDTQIFSQFVPSGMLFVPSIGGISHNVEEETDIEDLVKGIEVLAETLYKLAY